MSLQESIQKLNEIDFANLDLNNIDFNNVGSWPLAGKVAIWVLLFAVLLVGSYQLNIKSKLEEYRQAESKEQQLRTDFEKKVSDSANLEAYRVQMTKMESAFEALLKQLPQDTEVPGLLDDISNKGEESGLVFNRIDLKPEKKEEFYIELPIEINVVGGYHDFGSFVSGIASLPRIVTLGDFKLEPINSKGAKNPADSKQTSSDSQGKGELSMTIIAKTYRYRPKDDGPAEAKSKVAGGAKAGGAK